ncbi:hypothetical protein IWQ60_001965 [Tieghemiomyces parasiticus]|uniref:Uncharacterized protein n=1 Tax=Tieghemiomyces parasiticus TaxID=78921 RepID=A0A9W8AJT0_9FUNG|nr:hypothetical protein IWQ60_001965 [Tieghemiomyces parasiticus]
MAPSPPPPNGRTSLTSFTGPALSSRGSGRISIAAGKTPAYKGSPLARNCSDISVASSFDASFFSDSSLDEPESPLSLSFIENCEDYLATGPTMPSASSSNYSASGGFKAAAPPLSPKHAAEMAAIQSDLRRSRQSPIGIHTFPAPAPRARPHPIASSASSSAGARKPVPRPLAASRQSKPLPDLPNRTTAKTNSTRTKATSPATSHSSLAPSDSSAASSTPSTNSTPLKPTLVERLFASKKTDATGMNTIGSTFNPADSFHLSHPDNPQRVAGFSEKVKGAIMHGFGHLLGRPEWEDKGTRQKAMGEAEMQAARALNTQKLFT